MFNKMNQFLIKRAAAFLLLLAAADLAFLGSSRWLVFGGLLAGTAISAGRFISNEWLLRKIFFSRKKTAAGSIATFTLSFLFLFALIAAACFLNIWVWYGAVAGALTVPIMIMINSITEALGITNNKFQLGGD